MVEDVTIGHSNVLTGKRESEIKMPRLGLGVWQMIGEGECKSAVSHALNSGYRLIDTARAYSNEQETGEAVIESDLPREEIFVVTKLRRVEAVGYEETIAQCKSSLEKLGLEYMDLYLVHAPPEDIEARPNVWKGMEECLALGLTRSIGVSNYGAHHLDEMRSYATVLPSINQIEIHVLNQRPALCAATRAIGAIPMGYSPLARGQKILVDERLKKIADSAGCTPAQAAIKWVYDTGAIVIPKSSNPERIEENLASIEINLAGSEEAIASMEEGYVSGWNPTIEH
ncbi:MAG: aldo/keto reductase [Euryarchaeota archaeon]|jgi:diketogulonate reductase-like aldo/keto reductase|nr:aldo/keto reductase [Euryarchaeota archaeon]MBT3654057.1 aldo/keto reductase [Euryarchaeota archaeon]MBT3757917.1 aldo/keto reductase [Euryarchaeota archaeon]MBT4050485.1 aldo/keto reductase [Euryarchaeota archaeon]MBT4346532.1 aldo/keto reductase [Euryarchaeota archaeon]|tara:strand:+ start:1924 stop:2778 length:855 start_codon:yes stop_codon:yes gene_type:complete